MTSVDIRRGYKYTSTEEAALAAKRQKKEWYQRNREKLKLKREQEKQAEILVESISHLDINESLQQTDRNVERVILDNVKQLQEKLAQQELLLKYLTQQNKTI